MSAPDAPRTAVRIPVREAETIVRSRALAVGSSYQPRDGSVMAHLTVLEPFLPEEQLDDGVVAELERYFADEGSFGFVLTGVSAFPDGTAYLVPEPAADLRELTAGLLDLFPELRSAHERWEERVPHVAVPLPEGEDLAALQAAVAPRLPIDATAHAAALVRVAPGDTRTLARLPFGATVA